MQRPASNIICPLCGPSRRFVSQTGLRMHMQEKHPWRQSTPSIAAIGRISCDELQDDIFDQAEYPSAADYGMLPARSVPNLNMDINSGMPTNMRTVQREMVESRRPWYNNPDYVGPKTLLDTSGCLDGDEDEMIAVEEEEPVMMRRWGRPKPSDRLEALQQEAEHQSRMPPRQYDSLDSLVPMRRALAASGSGQKYLARDRSERGYDDRGRYMEPEDPMEPNSQLEDYMRDLQRRATTAEREARQLRSALALSESGSGHGLEDSDTESLFLPPARVPPRNRARPRARLRTSVDEELIEPMQAKRFEQLPPPFHSTSARGQQSDLRDKTRSESWYDGSPRRRETEFLKPDIGFRQNCSDSGFDSAATSKDAGPVFRWPAIGQPGESSKLPWDLLRNKENKGPSSGASSVTSVTDEDRSSLAQRSPMSLGSLEPVDDVQRRCEALFCIFQYLDSRSLARVSRVCREWYHVSHQPSLWRRVRISRALLTSRILATMTRWCTQVEELVLESVRAPPHKQKKELSSAARRKANQGHLETGLEKLLKTNTNTLKSIKIINCDNLLTEHALWLVSCHCPRLLKIVYLSDCDPVGSEVLWALAKGCPQIQTMVVPPVLPNEQPNKFDDRCCQMIGECWPLMQVLCVGGRQITDEGLFMIAKNCPKLRHLELDHGPEVTEPVAIKLTKLGLKGLEILDFTFTPVTPKAVAQFNSACPMLRKISVHVGISDFYQNVNDPKHKTDFTSLCNLFQSLRSRPGFSDILELKLDYG